MPSEAMMEGAVLALPPRLIDSRHLLSLSLHIVFCVSVFQFPLNIRTSVTLVRAHPNDLTFT